MNIVIVIIDTLVAWGNFLWGAPLLICLFLISLIYTIGTKGFQIRYFIYILKNTFANPLNNKRNNEKGVSSFRAFCMALCNTLGVGNIAGVGVAISLGGPGAVVWILLADVLALIIKYSEILLGVKYREINTATGQYRGGLMWYVEKGLGKRWRWIAIIFAAFYGIAIINTPAVQINSMASAITTYFTIPTISIGIFSAVMMGFVLIGGLSRISKVAGKIVPFMAALYLLGTLFVLLRYCVYIPKAISLIFQCAINDTSAIAGGFGGATVAQALRYGFARGFYSNGAGCGDAPFAHSSANVEYPVEQAMWGVSEVFVDAIVCTCTALVILITGAWKSGLSGAQLTTKAFAIAFQSEQIGGIFVSIIIAFFAFTTAVVCAYFGEICISYIVKDIKSIKYIYRTVMCLSALAGSSTFMVNHLNKLWLVGDFNLAIDTILSILVLFLMRKEVFQSTQEYKNIIKKGAH